MSQGLLSAISAANAAADHFARAVCAALPSLKAEHPAQRGGYLQCLMDRTDGAAAAEVGGTVAQQRAIRKAHRRYRAAWENACAALRASTKE